MRGEINREGGDDGVTIVESQFVVSNRSSHQSCHAYTLSISFSLSYYVLCFYILFCLLFTFINFVLDLSYAFPLRFPRYAGL